MTSGTQVPTAFGLAGSCSCSGAFCIDWYLRMPAGRPLSKARVNFMASRKTYRRRWPTWVGMHPSRESCAMPKQQPVNSPNGSVVGRFTLVKCPHLGSARFQLTSLRPSVLQTASAIELLGLVNKFLSADVRSLLVVHDFEDTCPQLQGTSSQGSSSQKGPADASPSWSLHHHR